MSLLVQKFGGTSVADPERMRAVAEHIALCRRRGDQVVLVVSAMGKETDHLLRAASDITDDPSGREMDMLITAGERKSIALMCMALHAVGIEAASFTGSQAGFKTDTNHMNAKILEVTPFRISEALDEGKVPVVAGAQGVSTDNDVTFLGRGGSDTTAVALAEALSADACELYTDVSGVFTTDPRLVTGARKLGTITFDELLELTAAGCPKPAARSVEFAHNHNVPLHVRSAFTWEPGTWVVEEDPDMEKATVRGVTHDTSEAKVTINGVPDEPGVAARIFRTLADDDVNVDMIVQNVSVAGVTDISFTVPKEHLARAESALTAMSGQLGDAQISTDTEIARLSIVGAGMKSNPGVAATMFETLAEADINIDMISTSAIRTSCVVRSADVERGVAVVHEAFQLHLPAADRTV